MSRIKGYWKVPLRQVYCKKFWHWVGATIYCHVVLRLNSNTAPRPWQFGDGEPGRTT